MSTEYLYLLRDQEGSAFKIGVSRDPRRRSVSLPQAIDFDTSLQIAMNGGRAYVVERLLHYWFRDHAHAMPRGDGSTEWFGMEAWPDVLAFIEGERLRLGLGEPQPIQRPTPAAPRLTGSEAAERQRIQCERAAQRRTEQIAANKTWNIRAAERLQELIDALDRSKVTGTILVPSADSRSPDYPTLIMHGPGDQLRPFGDALFPFDVFPEDGCSWGVPNRLTYRTSFRQQEGDEDLIFKAALNPRVLRPEGSEMYLWPFRGILLESFTITAPGAPTHAALLEWHEEDQRDFNDWLWGRG